MFLAFLLLSLAAAAGTRQLQGQRNARRFEAEVAVAQGDLMQRVGATTDAMLGIRALIHANGGLDRRLFHDYLSSLELRQTHPGILAVTFGVPLQQAQRSAFLARMRAEGGRGGPPFTILPEGERPDYFVVIYGEPEEANRGAIGFDTLSLPGQRASLNMAIDTGRLVASAPMKVRQYDGPDPSLVLRLAVYRKDLPSATPEQRRRAVYGCINGVFRAQELIGSALTAHSRDTLGLWIEDIGPALTGYDPSPRPLTLYGEPAPKQPWWQGLLRPEQTAQRHLTVGNRIWRIHFSSQPLAGDHVEWLLAPGVFLAGLTITLLLCGLLGSLSRTGALAKEIAERMTEQARASDLRLRAIAQAVPDLLFVLDEDGRYLEVHGGQDHLLTAPRPELLGRTVHELLPPDVAANCMVCVDRALRTHQLQTMGYELNTERGILTFEARLLEMGARVQGKRCVVVLARDITERSRAEENLRMTQKLESLGLLAGGIAHDFNNLLTALLGNLNLAQLNVAPDSAAAPFLQRAETTTLRAAELAHQMLAYSGRGTFTVENLDLNQVVEEMTELLAVSISKKATLVLELTPGLQPLLADAVQLQQVVMNLVTNASEALGDKGGTITIGTGERFLDEAFLAANLPAQPLQPGLHVTLQVTDTGCGMGPTTLQKIFDPFFTTKTTGRGLGLSAMLGILRGHRAGIIIKSEPGAGSSFLLLFPAAQRPPAPEAPEQDPAAPRLTGTVLLVDDEAVLRLAVATMLESLGLRVLEAADGVEALAVHAAHAPEIDVVLLDITMPRLDGNAAFLAIRQRDPDLPVILCSGFTIQEMVTPPRGARPADFLQKPFRLRDLQAALERALHPRQAQPGDRP